MKNARRAVALLTLTLVGGCATGMQPYSPATVVIKTPQEGVVTKAELGDTLMVYAIKKEYDALEIQNTREYSVCLYALRVGEQVAYAGARAPNGAPVFITQAQPKTLGSWESFYKDIRIEPDKNDSTKLMLNDPYCGGPQPLLNTYRRTTAVKIDDPGFSQELIYNGRVDNDIKFIYREFSNQLVRDAFTQEVQYDLELSSVIGFKGVRLEIIEATNSEITYRVKNHFKLR